MKRIYLSLLFFFCLSGSADAFMLIGSRPPVAAAGGCTEEVTDDFSDSGNPPTGWTEHEGTDWADNGTDLQDTTSTANAYIANDEPLATADQYVKVDLDVIPGTSVGGVGLRATTATGDRYVVRYSPNDSEIQIRVCTGATLGCTTFHTISSVTIVNTDVFATQVTGSDAATTEFYIWKNPVGTDPDDWGDPDYNACDTLPCTYTVVDTAWGASDPSPYVNSGPYAGIYDGSPTQIVQFDNYASGSCS